MHFHIPPALFAAVKTDELMAAGFTLIPILTIVGITVGSAILANWAASHVVAKEKATIGRAVLTFFTQLAWMIFFALMVGLAYFFLGGPKADPLLLGILGIVAFIVYLIVLFSVPMRIYEITASRALGFNLLSGFIAMILSNVANLMAAGSGAFNQLPGQFERVIAAVKERQHAEDTELKELKDRQATLTRRYEQLEIRRKYLPPYDRKAFLDYERDRAAYERDLEQLRADSGH